MVKLTLQALCLSMLSYTIASPLATTTTDIEAVEHVTLDKRAQNRCEYFQNANFDFRFTVWMGGWGNNDDTSLGGCGTGFLDNLRGQCTSEILDWGCGEIHENPHDTQVTWHFPGGPEGCVEEAFRLASPGQSQTVTCVKIPKP